MATAGVAGVEIRTFDERDRAELRALFGRAGDGAPAPQVWGHEESVAAVYLTPYMDLEPESLFVAVSGGALVGYLTGCVDSAAFPTEADRMKDAIKRYRLVLRPRPAMFFARSVWDTAWSGLRRQPAAGELHDERWPAHLHINVLPEVRGAGAAEGLMNAWLDRLRVVGSPGCSLQTQLENHRAVRFFTRMGFEAHGTTPLIPGVRSRGRRIHQQTRVWSP